MFSVGVIFYIILTGRPLFKGNTPEEILDKNMRCDYRFTDKQWENVSEPAKDLVSQLLKEIPDERITAADALNHPWFSQENNINEIGVQFNEFNQQRKKLVQ